MSMDAPDETAPADKPLTSLLTDLVASMTALVSKEVELAKAELMEKASEAGRGVGQILCGGAFAFCGLLLLLAAATLGLSHVMAPWAAALVVGGAVILLGLVLMMAGRAKLQALTLSPRRTLNNLRTDAREVADAVSR
ncbi:phage holin family protein [Niveispirillum sp. BGYR6]|uniref:phage holin family protein n=1 Tax=Niveispirillum sp. BGYR6 TaxID=2971249 RepID=UPI0022B993FC|nr:phage holin family protein [Niveispirillum sp. BGYR6]MDG5496722.1 phage holin family protein [Niveispirillum sp. BGYR6]